jgi:hypothetical protein
MEVNFIGGGNRSKLPICFKSLTNLSPYVVSSTLCHVRNNLNSQGTDYTCSCKSLTIPFQLSKYTTNKYIGNTMGHYNRTFFTGRRFWKLTGVTELTLEIGRKMLPPECSHLLYCFPVLPANAHTILFLAWFKVLIIHVAVNHWQSHFNCLNTQPTNTLATQWVITIEHSCTYCVCKKAKMFVYSCFLHQ